MKNYFPSVFAVVCSIFLATACSPENNSLDPVSELDGLTVTPSMKGWELYSWPEGTTWKFSFLTGTINLEVRPHMFSFIQYFFRQQYSLRCRKLQGLSQAFIRVRGLSLSRVSY